jgi:hypothetical protein
VCVKEKVFLNYRTAQTVAREREWERERTRGGNKWCKKVNSIKFYCILLPSQCDSSKLASRELRRLPCTLDDFDGVGWGSIIAEILSRDWIVNCVRARDLWWWRKIWVLLGQGWNGIPIWVGFKISLNPSAAAAAAREQNSDIHDASCNYRHFYDH